MEILWKRTASEDFHSRKLDEILVFYVVKCTLLVLNNGSTQKQSKLDEFYCWMNFFSNIKQNLLKCMSIIMIHVSNYSHNVGKSSEVFWRKPLRILMSQEPPKSANLKCFIAKKNSWNFFENRRYRRCCPVIFTQFLRAPFLQNTSERLLYRITRTTTSTHFGIV